MKTKNSYKVHKVSKVHKVFAFCFITFNFLLSTVFAQSNIYFYIKGNISDCQKKNHISYAHIINETSGFATACDSLGLFAIKGKIDDILKISSVGYKNKFLLVTESFKTSNQKICIASDTIILQEVIVLPFSTYSQFKSKFLSLKIENNTYSIPGITLKNPTTIHNLENDDYIKSLGFALSSPISYLYYNLSKHEKNIRKYHELENDKWNQYAIAQKFNPKIVEKITGLNDKDAVKFIVWCNLSKEYLLNATDYEIATKIKEKFELYCYHIDNK